MDLLMPRQKKTIVAAPAATAACAMDLSTENVSTLSSTNANATLSSQASTQQLPIDSTVQSAPSSHPLVYNLTVGQNKRLWKSIYTRIQQQETAFAQNNGHNGHCSAVPIVGSSPLVTNLDKLTTELQHLQLHKKTLEDFAVDYFIHRHNQRHDKDPDKHLIRAAN